MKCQQRQLIYLKTTLVLNLPATTWQDASAPSSTIARHRSLCASASVAVWEADVPMRRGSRQIEQPPPSIPHMITSLSDSNNSPPTPHAIQAPPPLPPAVLCMSFIDSRFQTIRMDNKRLEAYCLLAGRTGRLFTLVAMAYFWHPGESSFV